MEITISAKWKELFWCPVPIFLCPFSCAWMICGSLRRSAWTKGNCNGDIIYCAAHDTFMVKKSFVFENLSKTNGSWSSWFYNVIPETNHYRKWWKREVISCRRRGWGWGAGYKSYFTAKARGLGEGGGGEKPSDVLLWFINSRIVPWAGSTWELASDVHGFGFEVFLCYPLSRSYQITPIFGGLTK